MLEGVQEQLNRGPADDPVAEPRRRSRLTIAGIVCFLIGLPMVSITDSAVLSGIGFLLEAVAAVAIVSFVIRLAGEGERPDPEEPFEEHRAPGA